MIREANVGRLLGVVTLWNGDTALLPHFLNHYRAMGLDRMCVLVNRCVDDAEGVVSRYASEWATVRLSDARHGHEPTKDALEEEMLVAVGAEADDWILRLDLDEFHQFPGTARQAVEYAASRGEEAVHGQFLDRIAADGSFAPILPDVNIGEQFPIGLHLTGRLMKGAVAKVMIAKRTVKVSQGHHSLARRNGTGLPHGTVHHFKWKAGVLERLRERWEQIKRDCPVVVAEMSRLAAHITANGGRVNVKDASLGATRSGRLVPHEASPVANIAMPVS